MGPWPQWGRVSPSETDHRDAERAGSTHCVDGMATADVCRKHGVSTATFYKYKARFGSLEVSDARRLRALEDENAKLKKLLAEAMLDNAILKDVASRKWERPAFGGRRWHMSWQSTV